MSKGKKVAGAVEIVSAKATKPLTLRAEAADGTAAVALIHNKTMEVPKEGCARTRADRLT